MLHYGGWHKYMSMWIISKLTSLRRRPAAAQGPPLPRRSLAWLYLPGGEKLTYKSTTQQTKWNVIRPTIPYRYLHYEFKCKCNWKYENLKNDLRLWRGAGARGPGRRLTGGMFQFWNLTELDGTTSVIK